MHSVITKLPRATVDLWHCVSCHMTKPFGSIWGFRCLSVCIEKKNKRKVHWIYPTREREYVWNCVHCIISLDTEHLNRGGGGLRRIQTFFPVLKPNDSFHSRCPTHVYGPFDPQSHRSGRVLSRSQLWAQRSYSASNPVADVELWGNVHSQKECGEMGTDLYPSPSIQKYWGNLPMQVKTTTIHCANRECSCHSKTRR